ncbi:MAG: hypothetical protein Q8Q76_02355 [Methylotenera sp.]|nr:hypothetical protein [Methylotenera sp.]
MTSAKSTQSITAYDNAPFFEKAFTHAVQHNYIGQTRIDEIINEAATGSIQIADYFGESSHLRKNLEVSMTRMVSLVSLYLEDTTDAQPDKAAQLLKEKPFRALSRGGSQMLKALYSLPEDDYFGSPRLDSEREFLNKYLSKNLSGTKYRQMLTDCERFKRNIDFATLLAKLVGATINQLNEHHASAEHVIRTSLLSLAYGTKKIAAKKAHPYNEAGLFEIFSAIRKEYGFLGDVTCKASFIEELPLEFRNDAISILSSINKDDIPKIVNQSVTLESAFRDLKDRKYFYVRDQLNEVSRFDQRLAADWFALTGGTEDDALLLTVFLCTAAGVPQKTTLKRNEVKKAVLSIRENGLMQNAVLNLIKKAPHDEMEQLSSLWDDFVEEATPFLLDDSDENLNEVMTYLADRCSLQKLQ